MDIKFKLIRKSATLPKYASETAAAMDLYADIGESITIKSGERAIVPTGLQMEMPKDCCAFVMARSGLSTKHGIALANGVGLIDSDYRGEIGVALINLSNTDYVITHGDRMAQLLITTVCRANISLAESLSETSRGEGGFGSTGSN